MLEQGRAAKDGEGCCVTMMLGRPGSSEKQTFGDEMALKSEGGKWLLAGGRCRAEQAEGLHLRKPARHCMTGAEQSAWACMQHTNPHVPARTGSGAWRKGGSGAVDKDRGGAAAAGCSRAGVA